MQVHIRAYTINDFCRYYGIGRTKTYGEIAAGRLLARKVGKRTLILKSDADRWLTTLPTLIKRSDGQSE
jgi:excisionase family DNA binding protein